MTVEGQQQQQQQRESEQVAVEGGPGGDECTVTLVQTVQQKINFQSQALFGVPVYNNNQKSNGGGKDSSSTTDNDGGTTLRFRTSVQTNSSSPPKSEYTYKTLNDSTLRSYYGTATPYGTVQRYNTNLDTLENAEDFKKSTSDNEDTTVLLDSTTQQQARSSGSRTVSCSSAGQSSAPLSAAPVYATLIRAKVDGVRQITFSEAEDGHPNKNLSYVDFLPQRARKQGIGVCGYESFETCVEQANAWLSSNLNVDVIKCESLRHRLDHSHHINPNATSTDDRSYIIGLRVWVSRLSAKRDVPLRLEYCNLIPDYKKKNGKWKAKDSPRFIPLRDVITNWNEGDSAVKGELLNVESIPLNYAVIYRGSSGEIDADSSYCCLDFQGRWTVMITRLFFLQDTSKTTQVAQKLKLHYRDFQPAPLSLPPAKTEFQSYEKLIVSLNRWLKQEHLTNIVGLHSVEVPFRAKSLAYTSGKIDTETSGFEAVRNSVHWNSVRCLRVWYCSYGPVRTRCMLPLTPSDHRREISVAMRCFTPHQLTTSGCCGIRKPIFEATSTLWERVERWIGNSGVSVLSIETDNVEKWAKSDLELGKLAVRTFNKEDHVSTWAKSSMDYRFTVIRVFYDANSMKVLDGYTLGSSPPPPNPAKPYCCFVGCSVM